MNHWRTIRGMGKKKERYITVSFIKKKEIFKNRDGTAGGEILTWSDARYSESGVKRYNNCLMVLAGINGVTRDLMDWLTMQMNPNNKVYNNDDVRNEFIQFITKSVAANKEFDYAIPSHRTIKESFKILHNRGLLLKAKRGIFMVNPEYFMNPNNDSRRDMLIKLILEFRSGTNTTLSVETEEKEDAAKNPE